MFNSIKYNILKGTVHISNCKLQIELNADVTFYLSFTNLIN